MEIYKMAFIKQIRIREALNGYVCSTSQYQETIFKDLEAAISFIRKYLSKTDKENRYNNSYNKEKQD